MGINLNNLCCLLQLNESVALKLFLRVLSFRDYVLPGEFSAAMLLKQTFAKNCDNLYLD